MAAESFIEKARSLRAELRSRDAQLQAQERGVRSKRIEIAEQLQKLDAAISLYRDLMPDAARREEEEAKQRSIRDTVTILNPAEAASLTIVEAAALILEALGGEASTANIVAELTAVGKVKGSNPINTVGTQLRRFPDRFEWVSRGRWRLVTYRGRPPSDNGHSDLIHAEGDLMHT